MWNFVTRDVRTLPESAPISEVIRLMAAGTFRHVPVLDEFGRLSGIVSDRDIRSVLPAPGGDPRRVESFVKRTRVREIMTRDPICLPHDATLLEALRAILQHRVGALPVLDGERVVGILSQVDLLQAFAEHLEGSSELHIEEAPPAYETASFDPNRTLVFLVEPTEPLRRDLCSVLREEEIDVTVFAGLESLHAHGRRETPDLILLRAEGASPRDPLELLHERYPVTPVIMTREGEPPEGSNPSRTGPLFLPCSPETLLHRVRGAIGFNRWTHDLSALPAIAGATGTIDIDIDTPRQVLVIDPDPLARQVLAYHLKCQGCEVSEAADGHEALSRLTAEVFDLVCLDLDLPFRSGFELLDYVQQRGERGPRMVVVSGIKREDDVVQAFAMGALDYVKKPLDGGHVEQRLKRVLYD